MNNIKQLKIRYWSGTVPDFIIAFAALIPVNMRLSVYMNSMIAFSQSVLLEFGGNNPDEYRQVLLPVILIDISGTGIYSLNNTGQEDNNAYS